MREILFRGKRVDNGEWVKGDLSQHTTGKKFIRSKNKNALCSDEVFTETVGQYTGLTDKNGKKIFEGDIVKDKYSKGQYQYFKVIYDERTYRWETENKYGMLGQLCNVMGECEVIGNIHDNPELLKEGADNG